MDAKKQEQFQKDLEALLKKYSEQLLLIFQETEESLLAKHMKGEYDLSRTFLSHALMGIGLKSFIDGCTVYAPETENMGRDCYKTLFNQARDAFDKIEAGWNLKD